MKTGFTCIILLLGSFYIDQVLTEVNIEEVGAEQGEVDNEDKPSGEYLEKRRFQFGKREDDQNNEGADVDGLDEMSEEKRKFQFGKRKFQFGKRESDVIKRPNFQFGKRKFQFGKRMDDDVDLDDMEKRAHFQFGKRFDSEPDEEKRKFQFGKRKFQFGKRNGYDEQEPSANKRKFQFGKRKFQFGKRDVEESVAGTDQDLYQDDLDKRPFGPNGFKLGKRSVEDMLNFQKRPFGPGTFQFGKRYDDNEYMDKRSFQFGKREDEDEDWGPSGLFLNIKRQPFREYQNSALARNSRKFLLGKRVYDDAIRLSDDLKRQKVLLGKKRAFGGNAYHWKKGITDFNTFNEPDLSLSDVNIDSEKRAFGGGVNNNLFG